MTYILGLVFLSFLSWGVSEKNYSQVYSLLKNENASIYKQFHFTGTNHLKVVYTQFGFSSGEQGSVVIAPGRNESSLKYLELAHDLIEKGYSPIFVIDHQGQGFSERLLNDPQKGHIKDFQDYVSDFSKFTDLVLAHPLTNRHQLYLISHSMGGAIAAEYLATNRSPYRKALLSSPMLQIKNEKSESQLLHDTFLACYIKRICDDYIPGGGPFDWNERRFSSNDVTSSTVRYEFQNHLLRKFPRTRLGDPTIRWVREAVQANIGLRDDNKLNQIQTPILLLQAQKDQVVENRASSGICDFLGPKKCKRLIVKNSKHEILMERDFLRTPALKAVIHFFETKR